MPGPFARTVSNCCLALLMIPVALLTWFWFEVWHSDHVTAERERAATRSVAVQAHEASDRATRALNSARPTAPDAVIAVIARHTEAPLVTYDPARRTYTAVASWTADYTSESFSLNGDGYNQVERCFTLVFQRPGGTVWAVRSAERHDRLCSSGTDIAYDVTLIRSRIEGVPLADLTRTELARAVGSTRGHLPNLLRTVRRSPDTVVVTVLVRTDPGGTPVEQCYGITSHVDATVGRAVNQVISVPLATC